jgi:flavin reductase (DIM6/NTAB) family NADH-FMN oxidoreductase RutF
MRLRIPAAMLLVSFFALIAPVPGQQRVAECPVQMEGLVHQIRPFGKNVSANAFEVHIVKLHVEESLLVGDASRPHIDPEKWRPLIMSFCRFFGVGEEVHPSRLAESGSMKVMTNGVAAPRS